jgi:hypothetical protein
MEGLGEVQYYAFKILALSWGFLAIAISTVFFLCEWKPKSCDRFKDWLRKHFPALESGRKR